MRCLPQRSFIFRRRLRRDQTDAEKILWSFLRNKQFRGKRFLRQHGLGPYILDFYCPDIKLAIELDGGQHNECEGKVHDAIRSEYLLNQGVKVLRFWDHEVFQEIEGVLGKMEKIVTPPNLPL
jgi:very-short-patch-repair endonuclease